MREVPPRRVGDQYTSIEWAFLENTIWLYNPENEDENIESDVWVTPHEER